MYQCISLPLCPESLSEYRNWNDLRQEIGELGCDGLEGVWGGGNLPWEIPSEWIVGYHLTFFPDWLDFYRGDTKALIRKFGSVEAANQFYGGPDGETLLNLYRADLARAMERKPQYVVFHVSDVSIEEGYTYRWLHSDEEVIDVSAEVINILLDGRDWTFEFLVENQWWPGFTFTDPVQTERLLDRIHFEKKGILLDTGHLMNICPELRTQAEGAEYIQAMVERHGSLAKWIHGIHLHQSLSGAYRKKHTGFLPSALPEDYVERFRVNYGHILQIDQHRPWSDPAILPVLERIGPRYITHELAASNRSQRAEAVRRQRKLIGSI